MNPSTEDIVEAVLATPAKTVYVLPNNKNIILAAEQTIPLVTDRKVIVLPTRTIPQGLSAMLAYEGESTPEISANVMMNAANAVDTGLITFAARDSEFGGHKMKEGDILGLVNLKSLTKILCMQLLVWHAPCPKRELPLLPLFTVTMYLKRKQRMPSNALNPK